MLVNNYFGMRGSKGKKKKGKSIKPPPRGNSKSKPKKEKGEDTNKAWSRVPTARKTRKKRRG